MSSSGIPIGFQELDPDLAWKAIEGIPDALAGERRAMDAIYNQHKMCKNGCGPTMEQHFGGTEFAFADPNWLIPRALMKCHACGFTMNPFDGMIVALGDRNKAVHGDIPIIGKPGG
jgi:rubredoxin